MARPPVPAQDFTHDLTAGSATSAMKAAEGKSASGELFNVPPANIRVLEGFNVRIETKDYLDHVEATTASILENGFYKDKPLSGYAAKEGNEQIVYVTDGHTRLRAALAAIERGAEIATIPVILKPATQNLEDLTVGLFQANQGRALTPFEVAIVVKRLDGFGWDKERISKAIGKSVKTVENYFVLAGAPTKVRNQIIDGKISPTEALKLLKKSGGKAAGETIEAAVKDAEAKGKKKATGKDTKKAAAVKEPAAEPKSGVSSTVVTRDGKEHHTISFAFKQGEVVETDKIKPIRMFLDGSWWEYVDGATKTHVVVEDTVRVEVKFVITERTEDAETNEDATDDLQDAQDGEEGVEGTTDAPEDEDAATGGL